MPTSSQGLPKAELHLRLTQECTDALKTHAEDKQRSVNQLVRDILLKWLKTHPLQS
jgi:hypothetical protein